ncbi:hypothetical protein PR202_ga04458 [Eleusine coracana subsp. coracana]|uniref:AB hydrolase-1 domain-containing protein n=1 Tax=Eleusine coracana subsp. coracana TaxID=191504 RepID=A0AAV5BRT2_ELECO|nr:hypothetical protein PR202_ga04458 [Eleusine coracana subsp. coracana]
MVVDTIALDKQQQQAGQHRHHFVLVHGLCHGAWCWYKAATLLRAAGHAVTALDMAGCGAHPARLADVRCFEEYSRPLLDAVAALPPGDRAVLVAHSHGGYSVALAAERFPEKVAAAVFVTASLPAVGRSMAAATDEAIPASCRHNPGHPQPHPATLTITQQLLTAVRRPPLLPLTLWRGTVPLSSSPSPVQRDASLLLFLFGVAPPDLLSASHGLSHSSTSESPAHTSFGSPSAPNTASASLRSLSLLGRHRGGAPSLPSSRQGLQQATVPLGSWAIQADMTCCWPF